MASITGKVSFDELDPELLKLIKEGSSTIIDARFKVIDAKGNYVDLGLGKEFTLLDFIKLVNDNIKKQKEIEKFVTQIAQENYPQKFRQIERKIDNVNSELDELSQTIDENSKKIKELTATNEKLKERIETLEKNPIPEPEPEPEPEPDPNADYATKPSDYDITNDSNNINISVDGNILKMPISQFVTEAQANDAIKQIEKASNYIDENNELLDSAEGMNEEILQHSSSK